MKVRLSDFEPVDPDSRMKKKIAKIMRGSALLIGSGVGLLILLVAVAPFLGVHETAEAAIAVFAWCLVAHGILLILTFMFHRKLLPVMSFLMSWFVMPTILFYLVIDLL